ncbi:hypothetical protein [Sphingobacterium sp. FBM7-1]|uniref:hypothetical protein n=1 Tax=Sphingobacterium sp. FBM7-1 TaxID=2886688 RepID=UPI001D12FC00|nr:hypothetical protein [Sphingobacterium sp. FBM7-1]MCC2598482.1 hypothetical protein [Sphingobacterium sp. FBM7-1]
MRTHLRKCDDDGRGRRIVPLRHELAGRRRKVTRYKPIVCLCAHILRGRAEDPHPGKNVVNLPHVE